MTPTDSKNPRIWVNKDGVVKYIDKSNLDNFLNEGWSLGRTGYKPRQGGRGVSVFISDKEFKDVKEIRQKRKKKRIERENKPKCNKVSIEDLLASFISDRDNGLTIEEIVEKNHITRKEFFEVLRKGKIDKREFGYKKGPSRLMIDEANIQEMLNLLKLYGNFSKVGRMLGITDNAVKRRLKRRGYPYKIKELKKFLEEQKQ